MYDRLAAVYDRVWPRYVERTHDELLARVQLHAGMRVLDVGCGTGGLESRMLARCTRLDIIGIDISSGMIAKAGEKLADASNVTLVRANAEHLPLPDSSIDLILSASALHYFVDPLRALKEMRRVAVGGGRVAILDWCRESTWMRIVDGMLRKVDPAYVRAYTRDEILEMASRAGLAVESVERLCVRTYDVMVMLAHRCDDDLIAGGGSKHV